MSALFSRWRSKTRPDALVALLLRDLHPLRGGRVVWIAGESAVVQLVEQGCEKRYRFNLDPAELRALEHIIAEQDFLHLTIPDPMGQPDEARPEIFVRLGSGRERSSAKGQDEYCPGFDQLHDRVLMIARRAVKFPVEFDGPYDFKWVPADWK